MRTFPFTLILLAGLLWVSTLARAEEVKKPQPAPAPVKAKPEEKAPAAKTGGSEYAVKTETLVTKTKVAGTIESTRETPIEMNLKRWADMTVVKAVPHGTTVKAGETIIELETKDLVKKIEDLKRDMPGKEIELAAVELDLEKSEKITPMSLEKARREKMEAEQDLAYFEDVSLPMQERDAKEDVKQMTEALAYAQEELNQLKKMYEKDDLTEETEEIILRRSENTVASYQWMLEQSQARSERTLGTFLPREHASLKRGLELMQIQWRAGEKTLRDGLEKKRLDTAAKRREMEEARKSLAEHEEDLAKMQVTAPHDGIVYYGMSQRAKWTTASLVERKLIPGGKLTMREITMTVVDPTKVRVRLALTEEQLKELAEGQKATFQLKWKPDFKFEAALESVLYVPYADKTFDAVLSAKIPAGAPLLLPGMSADAEIVVYENKSAILVPKTALKKEGDRETVTMKDGKAVVVKIGRSAVDRVEILEGLKVGDILRVPEVKKEAAPVKAPEAKTEPVKKG